MKQYARIITMFVIFSMLLGFSTAWAVENQDFSVNVQNGKIIVSGTVGNEYLNEEIYIAVTNPDSRITDIRPGGISSLAYFNTITPDKNGKVEAEFSIANAVDDYYHLYVRANDTHSNKLLCEASINPVRNIVSGTAGIREDCLPLTGETVEARFNERLSENQNILPEVPKTTVSAEYRKIYVDSAAANGGDGTADLPFNKLTDAIAAVSGNGTATAVIIKGGTYSLDSEIQLGSTHSGTKAAPFIIKAEDNEKVVLTRGICISAASAVRVSDEAVLERLDSSVRDFVYEINMTDCGISAENYNISLSRDPRLFINGYEMRLARYPETAALKATVLEPGYPYSDTEAYDDKEYQRDLDTGFSLDSEDKTPLSWQYTDDIWMHGYFSHEWIRASYRVTEPFTATETGVKLVTDNVPTFYGKAYYARPSVFYYFNVLEELNSPGEWVADKANGRIYFYPPAESNLNDIVLLKGRTGKETVHWGRGVSDNIFKISGASNIVIDGINIENSSATGIYAEKSKNVKIQNCSFINVSNGCDFKSNISDCGVVYSTFKDIDNIGVNFGSGTSTGKGFPSYQQNYLQNCVFSGASVYFNGTGNLMSHNVISDTENSAVNLGGQDNIMEYNEIAGAPNNVIDAGALYLGGSITSRGNIVRYNYIHDFSGRGVYFDDRSSDNYAFGNIINGGGNKYLFFIHTGNENVFANNIVLNGYATENMNYYGNPGWPTRVMKAVAPYLKNSGSYSSSSDIMYTEEWQGRYPGIVGYFERMSEAYKNYQSAAAGDETSFKDACRPYNNVFYNNAIINSTLQLGSNRVDTENTAHDNCNIDITSADALSYVKSEDYSFITSVIPGFEAIDFSAIGLEKSTSADAFDIMNPEDNKVIPSTESIFIFNKIPGVAGYEIQVSENADFSGEVLSFTTVDSWCSVYGLTENTQYYWRVKAVFDELEYVLSNTKSFKTAKTLINITYENEQHSNSDDGIAYSATMKSNKAISDSVCLIAAAFDKDGNCLGCDVQELNGISETNDVSGTIEKASDAAVVKYMVWKSFDTMKPIE